MRPCPKWAWGEGSSPSSLAMGLGWTRAPSCGSASPYLASPPHQCSLAGTRAGSGKWEAGNQTQLAALQLCTLLYALPPQQFLTPRGSGFSLPSWPSLAVLVPVSVGRGRVSSSTVKWGFVIIWQRGLNGLRASSLSC